MIDQPPPLPGAEPPDPPPPPLDVFPAVAVVRWPAEAGRREALVTERTPRLLVLDDGHPAPLVWDDIEDWVREGAGRVELEARATRLRDRQASSRGIRPLLDTDRVLHHAGREVRLTVVDARLMRLLLDRWGRAVHRDALQAAGWPDARVDQRAVDGRITGLRRRLRPLGLSIATVRGVGYLLEPEPDRAGRSRD